MLTSTPTLKRPCACGLHARLCPLTSTTFWPRFQATTTTTTIAMRVVALRIQVKENLLTVPRLQTGAAELGVVAKSFFVSLRAVFSPDAAARGLEIDGRGAADDISSVHAAPDGIRTTAAMVAAVATTTMATTMTIVC